MEHMTSTTSAGSTREQIIQAALEQTKASAMKEAAKTKRQVKDVSELQRTALGDLLGAKGSDGAAEMGESMKIRSEVEKGIDDQHMERMQNIAAAPDAYVFERKDATVGLQHDDDRRIGLADDVVEDADLAKRVAKHEAEHREQETGDMTAELPQTGDAVIDQERELNRLTFREHGAIKAEGGLDGHTDEYHGYVETSNRVAAYLNEAGSDGDALVDQAGKTNAGFRKLHEEIQIAAIKKRLADGKGMPEFSNN